jgi:hypothetical protein
VLAARAPITSRSPALLHHRPVQGPELADREGNVAGRKILALARSVGELLGRLERRNLLRLREQDVVVSGGERTLVQHLLDERRELRQRLLGLVLEQWQELLELRLPVVLTETRLGGQIRHDYAIAIIDVS